MKHRFVFPLICAFIGCFTYSPQPGIELATLSYWDNTLTNGEPGQDRLGDFFHSLDFLQSFVPLATSHPLGLTELPSPQRGFHWPLNLGPPLSTLHTCSLSHHPVTFLSYVSRISFISQRF